MRTAGSLGIAAALLAALPLNTSSAQVASPETCGGSGGGGASQVSRQGPYEMGATEVVELDSEVDGGIIQIGIVRPNVPEGTDTPVIVDAGPYYWSDLKDTDLVTCGPFLVENFVQHGYAVAFVPTRGAGGTDRCSDLMGDAERADLDRAITWLGRRPWSGGSVGMTGISYDGSTPWEVASMGNPYLRTIVPVEGVTDLFSLIYRSGRADSRWWVFVPGYQSLYNTGYANPTNGRDPMSWAGAALCETVVAGLAASLETYVTGEDDATGYWAERNSRPGAERRYDGSVLVVQGFDDHNVIPDQVVPWVNRLERKGVYVKLLLGQWGHSFPDSEGNADAALRWDYADILLDWWDRWLKEDDGTPLGPRVEVQDELGRWRSTDSWPPDDAARRKMFLTPSTELLSRPNGDESRTTLGPSLRSRYVFVSDAAELAETPLDTQCAACAVFATSPQERDLHIAGVPSLDLSIVPHGPGGNVSAYLYRATNDDTYILIGYGSADVRFPKGGHEAHAVTPGAETRFVFNLDPMDAVVPEGERLVLALDQGNTNDMPGPPAFPVDLIYGGTRSSLSLPTITPDPDSFFTPPPAPGRS